MPRTDSESGPKTVKARQKWVRKFPGKVAIFPGAVAPRSNVGFEIWRGIPNQPRKLPSSRLCTRVLSRPPTTIMRTATSNTRGYQGPSAVSLNFFSFFSAYSLQPILRASTASQEPPSPLKLIKFFKIFFVQRKVFPRIAAWKFIRGA